MSSGRFDRPEPIERERVHNALHSVAAALDDGAPLAPLTTSSTVAASLSHQGIIVNLELAVVRLQTQLEDERRARRIDVENERFLCRRVQRQLEDVRGDLAAETEVQRETKDELRRCERALTQAKAALETSDADRSRLECALEALRSDLRAANFRTGELQQLLENSASVFGAIQSQSQQLNNEVQALQKSLVDQRTANETLLHDKQQLGAELQSVASETSAALERQRAWLLEKEKLSRFILVQEFESKYLHIAAARQADSGAEKERAIQRLKSDVATIAESANASAALELSAKNVRWRQEAVDRQARFEDELRVAREDLALIRLALGSAEKERDGWRAQAQRLREVCDESLEERERTLMEGLDSAKQSVLEAARLEVQAATSQQLNHREEANGSSRREGTGTPVGKALPRNASLVRRGEVDVAFDSELLERFDEAMALLHAERAKVIDLQRVVAAFQSAQQSIARDHDRQLTAVNNDVSELRSRLQSSERDRQLLATENTNIRRYLDEEIAMCAHHIESVASLNQQLVREAEVTADCRRKMALLETEAENARNAAREATTMAAELRQQLLEASADRDEAAVEWSTTVDGAHNLLAEEECHSLALRETIGRLMISHEAELYFVKRTLS